MGDQECPWVKVCPWVDLCTTTLGLVGLEVTTMVRPWERVCPWEQACLWEQACPRVVCTITMELEVLEATTMAVRSVLPKLIKTLDKVALEALIPTMPQLTRIGDAAELEAIT